MSTLRDLSIGLEYRTGENDLMEEFYIPCLQLANTYDRAAGFFSSSVFLAGGTALVDFAKKQGRLRLVCSPRLSEQDADALERGSRERLQIIASRLCEEIDELLSSAQTRGPTEVLAALVSTGALEVRIATRPKPMRLYHEKLGIFRDHASNVVSFRGSSNETWSAWHELGNHESFDVFRSWADGSDAARIKRHTDYFERLWCGHVKNVTVEKIPDAVLERLSSAAVKVLDDVPSSTSRGPITRHAQPHQNQAIDEWISAGKRGILEHATGSGKTFTAVLAMQRHLEANQPVLVLVPSQLLLEQWIREVKSEFADATMLACGAGHDRWHQPHRLESLTASDGDLGKRIVVATLQTASQPEFLRRTNGGDHLMIVCDEVHRAGSRECSNVFELRSGPRLGLSATPQRFGDQVGTAAILRYFGPILQPPFTLSDAIRAGRLVPYEYYPHFVSLTEEESAEWKTRSRVILREMAIEGGGETVRAGMLSQRLKLLLIQRARIAKKASGKLPLAVGLLTKEYGQGQSWLVYCEDISQLRALKLQLISAGLPVDEYNTDMSGDPETTLQWFRRYGGVLLSVRCLDEGIDIPSVSHALILASSQNPREFIQRRGRVLRVDPNNPGKTQAIIYDALVLPDDLAQEPDQLSLVKSELARAVEFARGALNRNAEIDLLAKAIAIGLDPDLVAGVGLEEDDDELTA